MRTILLSCVPACMICILILVWLSASMDATIRRHARRLTELEDWTRKNGEAGE